MTAQEQTEMVKLPTPTGEETVDVGEKFLPSSWNSRSGDCETHQDSTRQLKEISELLLTWPSQGNDNILCPVLVYSHHLLINVKGEKKYIKSFPQCSKKASDRNSPYPLWNRNGHTSCWALLQTAPLLINSSWRVWSQSTDLLDTICAFENCLCWDDLQLQCFPLPDVRPQEKCCDEYTNPIGL